MKFEQPQEDINIPPRLPDVSVSPKLEDSLETITPNEILPEGEARSALSQSLWRELLACPEVVPGIQALVRTLANAGVTVADVIPGAGDTVSWSADMLKFAAPVLMKIGLPNLDLTPTVSKKVAVISELVEIPTAGLFISHGIETLLQLRRQDWGLIKSAAVAIRDVLRERKALRE